MGLKAPELTRFAKESSISMLQAEAAHMPFETSLELAIARAALSDNSKTVFLEELLHRLVASCDCEAVAYMVKKGSVWSEKNIITVFKDPESGKLPKIPRDILIKSVTSPQPLLMEFSRANGMGDEEYNLSLTLPVYHQRACYGVLLFYRKLPLLLNDAQQLNLQTIAGMIGNHLNREEIFNRLREKEARLSNTIELAAIGICHVSPEGHFIYTNQQLCNMLGYAKDELQGVTVQQITHDDDREITESSWKRLHKGELESFKLEKRYLHKNGHAVWVRLTIALLRDDQGRPMHHVSIVEDISERKLTEARINYLATHDEMTDLPNRTLFNQMLKHAIDAGSRYQQHFSIMFVDLDRFKQINDSLGHEAGDKLLVEVAQRLKSCVRSSDIVARLGGDEFVILLLEVCDKSDVANIARTIIGNVIKPFRIKGQDCRVTASIGIASYPEHGEDDSSIVKNADAAMYMAKDDGKNNYKFYDSSSQHCAIEKLALESNIRDAFEKHEFQVHYQAKIDARTRQVCGAEALLRWNSAALGSIPPLKFIPVAEEIGIIVQMGMWVIHEVCTQISKWKQQGLPAFCVSVNLSPRQFMDENLISGICNILDQTGVAPELLELEITESMVMHNLERAIAKLSALKEIGLKIAIDDFGTGYSSLSQLKKFPIDTLKVDRSFIRDVQSNKDDQAITSAIIAMGKTLGLTVVAEGVETEEQIDFLSTKDCDELQGFYFSKPSDPESFTQNLLGFFNKH